MPPKTADRKATNRRTHHEARINTAKTGRDRLRHGLEWIAAEARHLTEAGLHELIDHIRGVAKTLNDQSAKGAADD